MTNLKEKITKFAMIPFVVGCLNASAQDTIKTNEETYKIFDKNKILIEEKYPGMIKKFQYGNNGNLEKMEIEYFVGNSEKSRFETSFYNKKGEEIIFDNVIFRNGKYSAKQTIIGKGKKAVYLNDFNGDYKID